MKKCIADYCDDYARNPTVVIAKDLLDAKKIMIDSIVNDNKIHVNILNNLKPYEITKLRSWAANTCDEQIKQLAKEWGI